MAAGKRGIAVAGNIVADKVNDIMKYPACGQLTKILAQHLSPGGCVPNVSIDLKKIDPGMDVYAVGLVGDDDDGRYVTGVLTSNGVDVSGVRITGGRTSFTEVMSETGGQRTFFTYVGADGGLGLSDIPFDVISPAMLHLGYFLLLPAVDQGEGLRILREATERDILTSIDLVSENSDRYGCVLPCLPYVDYLIINELEAGKLADMAPEAENMRAICARLLAAGVRRKVIVHSRDYSVCMSGSRFTVLGSLAIPREQIAGTTGAGDAFCAGVLHCIAGGVEDDMEMLSFASMAAAMALTRPGATDGLCAKDDILAHCARYGRMDVGI